MNPRPCADVFRHPGAVYRPPGDEHQRNPTYHDIFAVGVCVAFMALPQIPPRNTNWSGSGKWVHWAKVGFEKYYLRKMKQGRVEPFFEKFAMRMMGAQKLKGAL